MKKFINKLSLSLFTFTALLLLFATGCKPKDEHRDYSKDLIGKWKLVNYNGHTIETNNRTIFTFNNDNTGTQTEASIDSVDLLTDRTWRAAWPLAYTVDQDVLTTLWQRTSDARKWVAPKIKVENGHLYADPSTVFINSLPTPLAAAEYVSVTDVAHYAEDIIGTWVGKSGSGGAYGDINHQWIYLADGTYQYLSKNEEGKFVQDPGDLLNEYILDGDFFITRWVNETGEHREAWDVTLFGNDMIWRGLRANGVRDSFFLERITPVRADIEPILPGKWIVLLQDGDSVLTNEKSVHTFDGQGKVKYTVAQAGKLNHQWENQTVLNYTLMGNDLTEVGKSVSGSDIVYHSQFISVSPNRLEVRSNIGRREGTIVLERDLSVDNDKKILGFWEGASMEGPGTYGGADNVAWEYFNDGTYNYYTKDADGNWVEQEGEHDYMVDGKYLACRWADKDDPQQMDCEWWDLSFSEGDNPEYMYWDGYRISDGKKYHNTFTIKRSSHAK